MAIPRSGVEQAVDPEAQRTGKWLVMALVFVGVFMGMLDSSIINITLPAIARYFQVPLGGAVVWVPIAYLIVLAATLVTAGRLADMFGHKPVWMAGMGLFTVGSICCGLAPSLSLLVTARALQGFGGALMLSIATAMLTAAFPRKELGRAMGWNQTAIGVGVCAGPTLGGIITQHLVWRWVFFVNVPFGLASLLAAALLLREPDRQRRAQLDPAGAGLLAAGLATLTLGLSFGTQWGWSSPRTLTALTIAVAAFLLLLLVEGRVSSPILDRALFANRLFAWANVAQVLFFASFYAVQFLAPFYLVQLRGFGQQRSGLLLLPIPITLVLLGPAAGRLADRFDSRLLGAVGLGLCCLGITLASLFVATTPALLIVLALVVTGTGQAIFSVPNNRAVMSVPPPQRRGVASGILATGRAIGQSLSIAIAGAIFAALGGSAAGIALTRRGAQLAGAQRLALQGIFAHAFHTAMVVAAGIAIAGAIVSLLRGREAETTDSIAHPLAAADPLADQGPLPRPAP